MAKAHAGGIKNRIGNGRSAGYRRGLTRTEWRLARPRHGHHLDHRHIAKIKDRVAAPFEVGHRVVCRLELHLLVQGAAGGLQHIAVNLLLHARRVDQRAGVMPDHHAAHMHLAGFAVDFNIGHPGSPGRAKARPLAVHIARVGHALAMQHVRVAACGGLLRRALTPRLRVFLPAGALGRQPQQLGGARLAEVAQAELDRVHAGRSSQLVDVGLVRKGIGQRRHAAQPGGPDHGRHVVDRHSQIGIVVRRARRAVAHLKGLRHRLNGAREQQGQRGRAVGRVAGLKVVGGH